MRKVFVDTSAWFASIVTGDLRHEAAASVMRRVGPERWSLVTSNVVVFETHALLLNRDRNGHATAIAFLDYTESGAVKVVRVSERDEHQALRIVREHTDKDFSMTDALSFAVMEKLHIRDAISFDSDFREFGRFNLLA